MKRFILFIICFLLVQGLIPAQTVTTAIASGYEGEIPLDGETYLELIPAKNNIAASGTTALGSKSVGFFNGNWIDFKVYAVEDGWYDVGVNATNWTNDTTNYDVIVNTESVNRISVTKTVTPAGDSPTVDEYFVGAEFWNTSGNREYNSGDGWSTFEETPHIWLNKGDNVIRIRNTSGMSALHRVYVKKNTECTAAPATKHKFELWNHNFAWTGYGNKTRTNGVAINGTRYYVSWNPWVMHFKLSVPVSGYYKMTHIGGNGGSETPFSVYLNGSAEKATTFNVTGTGGYGTLSPFDAGTIYLNKGVNLLSLVQDTGNATYAYDFVLDLVEEKQLPAEESITMPMLNATAYSSGLPADGWATAMNMGGGVWIEYTTNVPEAGWYTLSRNGSTSGSEGVFYVTVNGDLQLTATNPTHGTYVSGNAEIGRIYLSEGANTIRIQNDLAQAFLGSITLTRETPKQAEAAMYLTEVAEANKTSAICDGTLIVNCKLNGTIDTEDATCIFAIYDNLGRLVAVDVETVLANTEDAIPLTIENFTTEEGKTYTAKAFMWNENMVGTCILLTE